MAAAVFRAMALSATVLGLAFSADATDKPDYSLKALGHLNCIQINDKINEGIAAGDAEAAYSSAQLLIRRICFKYDPKAYVTLLKKAVEGGHKRARWDLSYAYALGEGAPQSYAAAGELVANETPLSSEVELGRASPEMRNYTLGYGHALARLSVREVNDLPRRWWKHDHVVKVTTVVHTLSGQHTVQAQRQGDVPEGAADEAREAEELVREAAEDSLRKAQKTLAKPDKSMLVDARFAQPVAMRIFPSTSNRKPTAGEVDMYLPR